jgi:hypothetical protein
MTKSNQTISVITQLLSFTSSFKMSHLNNFQKSLIRTRLHEEVNIKTIALSLGSIKTEQDHQLIDFIGQNPDGNKSKGRNRISRFLQYRLEKN